MSKCMARKSIFFNLLCFVSFAEKELLVYEELRKGEKTNSFKVYIKEEFPADDHYASNENVQELIVVADEGLWQYRLWSFRGSYTKL